MREISPAKGGCYCDGCAHQHPDSLTCTLGLSAKKDCKMHTGDPYGVQKSNLKNIAPKSVVRAEEHKSRKRIRELISAGKSRAEIIAITGLSPSTVSYHINGILQPYPAASEPSAPQPESKSAPTAAPPIDRVAALVKLIRADDPEDVRNNLERLAISFAANDIRLAIRAQVGVE